MTAINSVTTPSTTPVLEAAASATARPEGKPLGAALVASLLEAERQTKQQRRQLSPEALLGTWRLRFTASKKPAFKAGQPSGSGFYIPGLAVATLAFSRSDDTADLLTIQNQLRVGPLKLRFTGPAKFLPKKNLLAFDFVRLQVLVGSLPVVNLPLPGKAAKTENFLATPVGKLPFFAFFAAQADYVAARGRGGGLALWARAD